MKATIAEHIFRRYSVFAILAVRTRGEKRDSSSEPSLGNDTRLEAAKQGRFCNGISNAFQKKNPAGYYPTGLGKLFTSVIQLELSNLAAPLGSSCSGVLKERYIHPKPNDTRINFVLTTLLFLLLEIIGFYDSIVINLKRDSYLRCRLIKCVFYQFIAQLMYRFR